MVAFRFLTLVFLATFAAAEKNPQSLVEEPHCDVADGGAQPANAVQSDSFIQVKAHPRKTKEVVQDGEDTENVANTEEVAEDKKCPKRECPKPCRDNEVDDEPTTDMCQKDGVCAKKCKKCRKIFGQDKPRPKRECPESCRDDKVADEPTKKMCFNDDVCAKKCKKCRAILCESKGKPGPKRESEDVANTDEVAEDKLRPKREDRARKTKEVAQEGEGTEKVAKTKEVAEDKECPKRKCPKSCRDDLFSDEPTEDMCKKGGECFKNCRKCRKFSGTEDEPRRKRECPESCRDDKVADEPTKNMCLKDDVCAKKCRKCRAILCESKDKPGPKRESEEAAKTEGVAKDKLRPKRKDATNAA